VSALGADTPCAAGPTRTSTWLYVGSAAILPTLASALLSATKTASRAVGFSLAYRGSKGVRVRVIPAAYAPRLLPEYLQHLGRDGSRLATPKDCWPSSAHR
jgi:hypothetical protein